MAAFMENENSPMVWTEIELSHNKPENKKDMASSEIKVQHNHDALISSTASSPRSPFSEICADVSSDPVSIRGGNARPMMVTPMVNVTANLMFDTEPRTAESVVNIDPETPMPPGNSVGSCLQAEPTTPAAMSLSATPEGADEDAKEEGEEEAEADAEAESRPETDEERIRREMEESERLCWEMMQQESMEAYNMQVEYMRENVENISEEDRAALELILQQEGAPLVGVAADQHGANAGEAGEDNGEEEEEGEEGGLDENSENWSYDQLLALGEAIGDVKTERWKQRALNVIKGLPRMTYGEICSKIATQEKQRDAAAQNESARHAAIDNGQSPQRIPLPSTATADQFTATGTPIAAAVTTTVCGCILSKEANCAICRDEYESGSIVLHLRCGHYFHDDCCVGWLNSNNSCPMCKTKVTLSP